MFALTTLNCYEHEKFLTIIKAIKVPSENKKITLIIDCF